MTTKNGAAAPPSQDEASPQGVAAPAPRQTPPQAGQPGAGAPAAQAGAPPAGQPDAPPEGAETPDAARKWIDDRVREAYHQAEQEPLPAHLVALLRRFRSPSP